MNAIKNWKTKTTVSFSIAALVIIALTVPMTIAQIPLPVTVQGTVTYANGTYVPAGWNVSMENLDEDYDDEPWTTTTGFVAPCWNYTIVGTAAATSTFRINVSDPTGTYTASETFTAGPATTKTINITVGGPPSVTVIYPKGGEEIAVGDVVEVSASASDDTEVVSVSFSYSADNGSTWNAIGAGSMVSGTVKDGIWNVSWNTAGLSLGNEYLIKAVATDNEDYTGEDTSDSTFSLADKGKPLLANADVTPSIILVNETTEVTFSVHAADKESAIHVVQIFIPPELPAVPEWKSMSCVGNYTSDNLTWGIYEYTINFTPTSKDTYNFTIIAYDLYNNTNFTEVSLEAVSWITRNITIYNGWNLISVPLMPENKSLNAIIPNAENGDWIYADKPGAGIEWKYAVYYGGWNDFGSGLTTLEPGEGYLYNRVGSQFNITVRGNIIPEMNTTIYTGWNLLGYAKTESSSLDIINEPYNGDWIYADKPGAGIEWKYAVYYGGWNDFGSGLTSFNPTEGYLYNRAGSEFYWTY